MRGARREDSKALQDLGIAVGDQWELSREVLLQQGIPASAILVPNDEAEGTLEELQAVYRALGSKDTPVILVTSKYHTRRVRLTWGYVTHGESAAIVRAAEGDPFDPARWWKERRFILSVVREYLGLINYYAGFPGGTVRGAGISNFGLRISNLSGLLEIVRGFRIANFEFIGPYPFYFCPNYLGVLTISVFSSHL